ncbi:MAG: glycoside hydrolase family 55 protein, partial [Dysgonamonadaceae bacterium]|nr:glycoside hydrolase family 55 protein [Dysgonamonadaceae bacterium]
MHKVFLTVLLTLISLPVFSQTGAQWQIIDSKYPSEDLGVAAFTDASLSSIDKTGQSDSHAGIQELLDRLGSAGGGTLYLSEGQYKISGRLLIPKGVVLRGDWKKPEKGRAIEGTVLMAYYGRGTEDEENAFITMESSTGVYNLAVWYPEQTPDNLTPYPPTVLYGKRGYWGNDYNNVRNVTLVNAWSGVILSRVNGGGCPNVFNLYGTPLSRGIEIDNIADVGRLDWINFSPDYWADSGLPGSPARGDAYSRWIRQNGTGIVMRRNDWSYTCHVHIEGYRRGFHAAESIPSTGSKPNGHHYDMYFKNCETGIYIEAIANAGMMFTRIQTEDCENGIVIADGAASTAQFCACDIAASSDAIRVERNASTKMMTQQCTVRSGKVNIRGGLYVSEDGDFNNDAPQVAVDASARVILAGNRFAQEANILNQSLFECKIDHRPVSAKRLPDFPDIAPRETQPERKALYVVTDSEFGAVANATTDNTAALQNALNKAGSEGGGVVFLPPGKYRVNGNLTVPAGVELKGASDLASVPKGQGSIIEIYAGKNDPDGTPFLQLSEKSGIRGLTFNYPEQRSSYTKNPATLPQYPYCIRATGKDVYIVNIGVRATSKGIDLFTHPCDNHYVDYFAGHVFNNGLRVGGGSKNGLISNVQFNSIVMASGFENPKFGAWPNSENDSTAKASVYNQNWLQLDFMILEDCEDEILYNNFHYASHKGLVFRQNNGKSPSGVSLGSGMDASMRAVYYESLDPDKGFDLINTQIVSVAKDDLYADTKYVETAPGFSGTAYLFASDYWGSAKYGCVLGGGTIHWALAHFQQYGSANFLEIAGNAQAKFSTTDVNAVNFVNSGKSGQVSVQSSVAALSSPTGYQSWLNNLTTAPVFNPGSTLPGRFG